MTDPHATLLSIFEDQTRCEDCDYRNREWNPDRQGYEFSCAIVDSAYSKQPIAPTVCPGVEDALAESEAD